MTNSANLQAQIDQTQYWLNEFQKQVTHLQMRERGAIGEIQLEAAKSQVEDLQEQLDELNRRKNV